MAREIPERPLRLDALATIANHARHAASVPTVHGKGFAAFPLEAADQRLVIVGIGQIGYG